MSAFDRPSGRKKPSTNGKSIAGRLLIPRLIFADCRREKPLPGNDFDDRGDFAAWYARGASKVKDTHCCTFAAASEGVLFAQTPRHRC
jgi:hypothetical protein